MATRRRSTGFITSDSDEAVSVEEFLNENTREVLESISRAENEVEVKPFVPAQIAPTGETGPRFVDETVTPIKPQPADPTPQLQPPPRRHPRNIPKFSRFK